MSNLNSNGNLEKPINSNNTDNLEDVHLTMAIPKLEEFATLWRTSEMPCQKQRYICSHWSTRTLRIWANNFSSQPRKRRGVRYGPPCPSHEYLLWGSSPANSRYNGMEKGK